MIRDIVDLFNRNLLNILLLSLILTIPTSFFVLISIQFFYELESVEFGHLTALFLMIVNFSILCPPFLHMVKNDSYDRSLTLVELLKVFVSKFGYVVFLTLFIYVLGVWGMGLLFIPTLLAVVFILLVPIFSDHERVRDSIKGIWTTIKKENLFIFLDILIILSLNLLVWSGSLYLMESFHNNNMVYMTLRAILNALLFPLLYFYLAIKYRKDLGDGHGN